MDSGRHPLCLPSWLRDQVFLQLCVRIRTASDTYRMQQQCPKVGTIKRVISNSLDFRISTCCGTPMSYKCSRTSNYHTRVTSCLTSTHLIILPRPQSDFAPAVWSSGTNVPNVSRVSDTPHSPLLLLSVAQTHVLRTRNTWDGPFIRWVARYHPDIR